MQRTAVTFVPASWRTGLRVLLQAGVSSPALEAEHATAYRRRHGGYRLLASPTCHCLPHPPRPPGVPETSLSAAHVLDSLFVPTGTNGVEDLLIPGTQERATACGHLLDWAFLQVGMLRPVCEALTTWHETRAAPRPADAEPPRHLQRAAHERAWQAVRRQVARLDETQILHPDRLEDLTGAQRTLDPGDEPPGAPLRWLALREPGLSGTAVMWRAAVKDLYPAAATVQDPAPTTLHRVPSAVVPSMRHLDRAASLDGGPVEEEDTATVAHTALMIWGATNPPLGQSAPLQRAFPLARAIHSGWPRATPVR